MVHALVIRNLTYNRSLSRALQVVVFLGSRLVLFSGGREGTTTLNLGLRPLALGLIPEVRP